jgi:glycosyltransferase involved in cell wall biosynthesis
MSDRTPIAFVVQRYGRGGSEIHCQLVAEHLAPRYDVTVMTTCAIDHSTWANHFLPGETVENGVRIRRFPTTRTRPNDFIGLSDRTFRAGATRAEELAWLEAQGPHSPELLATIERERERYAAVIFFTYLYEPTVLGMPLAADRAILVPTAHDEPPIRLSIYADVFRHAKWIVWNTPWERGFVSSLFGLRDKPGAITGCGIDQPPPGDATTFRRKHGVDGDVLVYVGRVEASKGCGELIEWSKAHQRRRPFTLALVGQNVMGVGRSRGILPLGYLSDQEKSDALAAATAFVMPSENESLSLVTLEAWLAGLPVLVTGRAPVLRDHVRASQGGLYYVGPAEFGACADYLFDHPSERARMAANGRRYVQANYSWPRIEAIYERAIVEVSAGRPAIIRVSAGE